MMMQKRYYWHCILRQPKIVIKIGEGDFLMDKKVRVVIGDRLGKGQKVAHAGNGRE
jgi:hypothetical protein